MTAREKIENMVSRISGAEIKVSEPTKFVYVSINGKMENTFIFTEDGNLQKSLIKKLDF